MYWEPDTCGCRIAFDDLVVTAAQPCDDHAHLSGFPLLNTLRAQNREVNKAINALVTEAHIFGALITDDPVLGADGAPQRDDSGKILTHPPYVIPHKDRAHVSWRFDESGKIELIVDATGLSPAQRARIVSRVTFK